jgi:hypothetical protein
MYNLLLQLACADQGPKPVFDVLTLNMAQEAERTKLAA